MTDQEKPDFLEGLQAIADALGIKYRRAHYMHERGELPTFEIAGRICARPSTLKKWLADREAAALAAGRAE